jgi:hypothetical protein
MPNTFRVQVGLTVKSYPADIASYGEHLAAGGATVSLAEARRQAREMLAANADPWITGVVFWATLDESGLAYRLDFDRRGHYSITAAAPMPGTELRELYDVDGYAAQVG